MRSTLLSRTKLVAAAFAALALVLLTQPPAHAGTWGAPQTVNSWNTINGRWKANNELETYTPACVWYEGGTLVIKTYNAGNGTYYSGRVESKALYGYGTYSFTANMPNGKGLLPAVWAAYLSPWLPEFDAAEIVGSSPNTVYQTFHDTSNAQAQWAVNNSGGWTNSFHTYSFTWWPDHIDFTVDGAYQGTKWYSTAAGVGMHFIVNTAVGGDWPGNPDSSTWATADGARYLKVSAITYTPYYP
ncbi:glycoside hydrolase family 16 protein [Streptomyces sp. NBC_00687]|uniref:glycoside hydrolase family 16 protein n=1 Tax=Streptomyces sp. NBC_00687 TaxID=2975807 RepID=UPI002252432B|nr:glycoside hydrolase family 16 protein [Streptomyces sp. NBC_00687]MCX4919616.1 glycoside hydrolase family 16 protein [Streptomyces sp. NBC_00687]